MLKIIVDFMKSKIIAPVAQGIEQRFPKPLHTFYVLKNQLLKLGESLRTYPVHPGACGFLKGAVLFVFVLPACGSDTIPVETVSAPTHTVGSIGGAACESGDEAVFDAPLYFSPRFTKKNLPVYLSPSIPSDLLQDVADFWNGVAATEILRVGPAPEESFKINFTIDPTLPESDRAAVVQVFNGADQPCIVAFRSEASITLGVIEHEVGHCLGFGHSYDCQCVMQGIPNGTEKADCDLGQLMEWANEE